MGAIILEKKRFFRGEIVPAADKSMSHRAVMLGSLAEGDTFIENILHSEDVNSTINAFKSLGISIESNADGSLCIHGKGLYGLTKPRDPIYAGNSGTTMRILMGILAGQNFQVILQGDESLSKRPMDRVIEPLQLMGASFHAKDNKYAPITINGGKLKPIDYITKVASAQVKSAVLFAGLYADGVTKLTEPFQSRDHTEKMFGLFGVPVKKQGLSVEINGKANFKPCNFTVPGDISSSAFFIVAGLLLEKSSLLIENTGINPTRIGILNVLKRMGANISIENEINKETEPLADIRVEYTKNLKSTVIEKQEIPLLIDEIPIIMVAACLAKGTTHIKGASELRVKETDRITSMQTNLCKMGAKIDSTQEDIIIHGIDTLHGAELDSFDDHRTAMACAIAACTAQGKTTINNPDCVSISFPDFFDILEKISK